MAIALAVARVRGWEVAVRGGGHSYTGASGVDDGLVIDLTEMRAVEVDPIARRATVGGGATWADFDAATQEHGLASTGGIVSHTGVGGLTLGGGMGWLVREHGLAIDNLVAAEVVTADGRMLRTSAERAPGPVLGAARRWRQLRRGHLVHLPAAPGRPGRARRAAVLGARARRAGPRD